MKKENLDKLIEIDKSILDSAMNRVLFFLITIFFLDSVSTAIAHPGHSPGRYHEHAYRLPNLPAKFGEPQSWSSIKHRIVQKTQLSISGYRVNVRTVIYNKDRTRGRTMCTEIQIREQNGNVVASQVMRKGIKRRGLTKGTRTRTLTYSVDFPRWVDRATATAWVIDSYCPKAWESRLGRTAGEFVKKPVVESIRASENVVRFVGKTKDQIINEISYSMQKIGGNGLQKAFDDVAAITRVIDDKLAVNALAGVRDFVQTGNFEKLNPIVVVGAAQLDSARAALYRKATPIPNQILALMPPEYRQYIVGARYIEKGRVPEVSAPHVGLSDAKAIVMVDVIVFHDGQVPSLDTAEGRHLWVHEMFHVYQYKRNGTRKFTEIYLGDELGYQAAGDTYPGVNTIEANADVFACEHEWIANPHYIKTCP